MFYVNVLLQDHIAQCNKVPVSCPNNCGGSFPREMVRLFKGFLNFVSLAALALSCVSRENISRFELKFQTPLAVSLALI